MLVVEMNFCVLVYRDSAMLEMGKQNLVILSTDNNLCLAAQRAGYEAENFNHQRRV
jgi:hypothetical protein